LAKKALAALNNNPEVFKGGPRPIVQFLAPKKREEGGQVEKRHTEAKASANKKPFNKKPFNKKPFDKKKFNKKKN